VFSAPCFASNSNTHDFVHLKHKKHPRRWFGDHCRGLYALFVVLFDADAAFELYLDAAGSHDDLFYQLLEYAAVICVHDTAVVDMLFEGVQPRFDLCVPCCYGFLFFLLGFQLLHPLAVCLYLCRIVRCADAAALFCLMQGEDSFLYLDDLLLDAIEGFFIFCTASVLYTKSDARGISRTTRLAAVAAMITPPLRELYHIFVI